MKDKKWKIAVVLLMVLMAAAVSVWEGVEIVRLFRAGETIPAVVLSAALIGLIATVILLIRSAGDE